MIKQPSWNVISDSVEALSLHSHKDYSEDSMKNRNILLRSDDKTFFPEINPE